jgi:hypothetical protein
MEQIERAARIASAHEFITGRCRRVTRRCWGNRAWIYRAASASGWRWRARCCCNRRCSSWTTRRHRWMRGRRTKSSALREAMAGRTTFVVSSRLSLLRRADFILVLEDGPVDADGHACGTGAPARAVSRNGAAADDGPRRRTKEKVDEPGRIKNRTAVEGPPIFRRGRRSRITIPWRNARRTGRRCNWRSSAGFSVTRTLRRQAELAVRLDVHPRSAVAGAGVADRPHHQRPDCGRDLSGFIRYAAGYFLLALARC